ncbi:hypothetical protein MHY85_05090 [Cellulomonas sp. ACRRI]|uniref:tail fiber domain-containing protein n=1 Tax=Cellulomonas sp. ACRRI TaxID=2918188 RepID=UPI001EF17944|nr:tail fiber domain-containing protein [Cellulomonas sp. ACRRI]MCG7285350.1 hypothetical protein [Cellulomonas sp. ACRRI]
MSWSDPTPQQYKAQEQDGVKRLVGAVQDVAQKTRDATKNLLRTAGIFLAETGMRIESALTVNGDFASTGSATITGDAEITGSTHIGGSTDIDGTLDVAADTTLGGNVDLSGVLNVLGGTVDIYNNGRFRAKYADGRTGAVFGPLTLEPSGTPDGMGLLIQAPDAGQSDIFRAKYDGAGVKRVQFGMTGSPVDSVWGLSKYVYLEATNGGAGTDAGMWLHSAGDVRLTSGTFTLTIPWATSSSAANMFLDNDGRIWKSTSARKYKQDIEDAEVDPGAVLRMQPRTWRDRAEVERDPACTTRYVGFIAEELDVLGLGQFVTRTPDGEVEGIAYDRLVAAVIPVLKDLDARLKRLESSS